MATAKPISMSVRPIQSADLCYPVSGIIEKQPEELLGSSVTGYDVSALQKKLKPEVILPSAFDLADIAALRGKKPLKVVSMSSGAHAALIEGPPSDGPSDIEKDVANYALSRLRADDIATQLTQSIAWYGLKFSADQADAAIAQRTALLGYNPSDPNSVFTLLNELSDLLKIRYDKLKGMYDSEPSNSWAESSGTSYTSGAERLSTTTTGTTTYYGRELELPWTDNKAKWLRSEISLRQEKLAAFRLVTLNSPENILRDKTMTAAEIRKIQLAYLDTFLVAPFDGVITAVFRNVGDFVAAGQPVVRLENDKTVYLIGVVKYRGLITVGYTATISSTLFGDPGGSLVQINGTVCAVRGHEPVDEQWNIIIRCDNQGPSGRILPLNYNFDYDNTEIDIQPV